MTTYGSDRPDPGERPGDGPVFPGMPVPPPGEVAPATPTVQPTPAQSRLPIYLAVVIGVAALCCIGGIAVVSVTLTDSPPEEPAAAPTPAGTPAPHPHRIGTPARDGQFEFTVDRVECGQDRIEAGRSSRVAEGQFCLARLTVTNVGDQPREFSGAAQSALDQTGARYPSDRAAALIANPEIDLYPYELPPGDRIDAVLAFDLPPGGTVAQLLLHEVRDSPGVLVTVT